MTTKAGSFLFKKIFYFFQKKASEGSDFFDERYFFNFLKTFGEIIWEIHFV